MRGPLETTTCPCQFPNSAAHRNGSRRCARSLFLRRHPAEGVGELGDRAAPEVPLVQAHVEPVPIDLREELVRVVLLDERQGALAVRRGLREVQVEATGGLAGDEPDPPLAVVLHEAAPLLDLPLHVVVGRLEVRFGGLSINTGVGVGENRVLLLVEAAQEAPEHKVGHEAPGHAALSCDRLLVPLGQVVELVAVKVDALVRLLEDLPELPLRLHFTLLVLRTSRSGSRSVPVQRRQRWADEELPRPRQHLDHAEDGEEGAQQQGTTPRAATGSHHCRPCTGVGDWLASGPRQRAVGGRIQPPF
mmetsp:Transcript_96726/g.216706  ORF Transcript_96726/g.216706 Transcript_96726/m.216706 type:complete len:304 (-) Transcript_96726:15-926(-)